MKILHIYKSYYPYSEGGVEKYIDTLSAALCSLGIYSDVIATSNISRPYHGEFRGRRVYHFPSTINIASCPISLSMWRRFRGIACGYDLLHYHFPWPFADLMHLSLQLKQKAVVTYHSDIVRQKVLNLPYQPLMRSFLNSVVHIAATSKNYKESSPVLKAYSHKTSVVPIGLSPSLYPELCETNYSKWRRVVGNNFFFFVGVLRYYKGLEFLLRAAEGTPFPIVIAGAGPEEGKLHALARKLRLSHVKFVGRIDDEDKVSLFQLCRAVIMPSCFRSEAFGISLLEGLMYGKPLISTELNTGTSFVNKHDLSGLVVPPNAPEKLRQAMQTLMQNEELYQRYRCGARAHYQENFTAQIMASKFEDIYQKAVALT